MNSATLSVRRLGEALILPEEFLNRSDHIHYLASPADTNGQIDVAVFIKNIQKLPSANIHRLVELKINHSHMLLVFSSQQRS